MGKSDSYDRGYCDGTHGDFDNSYAAGEVGNGDYYDGNLDGQEDAAEEEAND